MHPQTTTRVVNSNDSRNMGSILSLSPLGIRQIASSIRNLRLGSPASTLAPSHFLFIIHLSSFILLLHPPPLPLPHVHDLAIIPHIQRAVSCMLRFIVGVVVTSI